MEDGARSGEWSQKWRMEPEVENGARNRRQSQKWTDTIYIVSAAFKGTVISTEADSRILRDLPFHALIGIVRGDH